MKHLRIWPVLILVFFFSACEAQVKEPDYIGIAKTEFKSISFSKAEIKFYLEYFNPNKVGIDVKETDVQVFLNDKFIAVATQPEEIHVPKNSKFLFPVVAHFDPIKVLGPSLGAIFSMENKMYVKGSTKVGKGGLFIKIPVEVTDTVSLYRD
ncbi:MAG: LEA type 2 family protein [Chitinophagaceae bacterium]|nr:LEA type 2 family protein [Chitinophagaceae bacterium]